VGARHNLKIPSCWQVWKGNHEPTFARRPANDEDAPLADLGKFRRGDIRAENRACPLVPNPKIDSREDLTATFYQRLRKCAVIYASGEAPPCFHHAVS
jgi:hypothetical protein